MENIDFVFTEEYRYNQDIVEIEMADWNLRTLKNLKYETEKLLIELKAIMDYSDMPVNCRAIVTEIDRNLGEFESNYSTDDVDSGDGPISQLISELKKDMDALKKKLKQHPEDKKEESNLDAFFHGVHITQPAADDGETEDQCPSDDRRKYGRSSWHTSRDEPSMCSDDAASSRYVVILSSVFEDVQTAHTMCSLRGRLRGTPRTFRSRSTATEMPAVTSQALVEDTNAGHRWTTARDRDRVDLSMKTAAAAVARSAGRFALKTVMFILFAASLVGGYCCWNSGRSEGLSAPDYSQCAEHDVFRSESGGSLVDNRTNFTCERASGYYGEHRVHERYPSSICRFLNGLLYNDVYAPNMWWSFSPFARKLQQKTILTLHQDQMKNALDKFNDGGEPRPSGADAVTYTRISPANRLSSYSPAESENPINIHYNGSKTKPSSRVPSGSKTGRTDVLLITDLIFLRP